MKAREWMWWGLALAAIGDLGNGEGEGSKIEQTAQNLGVETYSITTQGIKVTYTQADANGHPAIYATQNGKVLWKQEYGAYCTKANQEFYKGFRLVINKVIIVDCNINGNLVDTLPKSLFISPRKGILDYVSGRLLGEDKKGILIYEGSGLSRKTNGNASFGIIKITKYDIDAKYINESYISDEAPPKECQKGYSIEGEDVSALFWTPYQTKGSKIYFSLSPQVCNYNLYYDLVSKKTTMYKKTRY